MFLRHYKKLDESFTTPHECYKFHDEKYKMEAHEKMQQKFESDSDSILGTYKRINPNMTSPNFYKIVSCNELDRTMITRYRVGSHKLRIQRDRSEGTNREERLCTCRTDIQSVSHVIFSCHLTENIRRTHDIQNTNLESFFNGSDLIKIASSLKAIQNTVT